MISFLDSDLYKFTMGQFVFHRYPDVPVRYEFTNRTKRVPLGEILKEQDLRHTLDCIRFKRPKKDEIDFLRTLRNGSSSLFQEDYLKFLENITLPKYELDFCKKEILLSFCGPWSTAIYWETPALAAINSLYYESLLRYKNSDQIVESFMNGERRLRAKIFIINGHLCEMKFMEFGTRRRFCQKWQERVFEILNNEVPDNMIGTSNVYLAKQYGVDPMGTMAHELFMVMSGIMHENDDSIRASHNHVLEEWFDEYGEGLSIALTDTYGTDFFFQDITPEQLKKWKGLRQDSGDPSCFAEEQIKIYEENGINPKTKLFVPSDGLDIGKISDLSYKFQDKIQMVSGWGTNLTNDLDMAPLALVIKAVEANGHGTVKLSDDPGKVTGKPEDVERFKRIFEYDDREYRKRNV